jgi:actin-related protein
VAALRPGLHEHIMACASRCDFSARTKLLHNVVLAGGMSLVTGSMWAIEQQRYAPSDA